jgi:hypothetical protein
MHLHDGSRTDMGIMVHNKVKSRGEFYANQQAAARGGDKAIMTGKIKRKYLFRNPSTGSGFGDEYAIPTKYYDKIKDTNIRSWE